MSNSDVKMQAEKRRLNKEREKDVAFAWLSVSLPTRYQTLISPPTGRNVNQRYLLKSSCFVQKPI